MALALALQLHTCLPLRARHADLRPVAAAAAAAVLAAAEVGLLLDRHRKPTVKNLGNGNDLWLLK